jgi:hypothetical protein
MAKPVDLPPLSPWEQDMDNTLERIEQAFKSGTINGYEALGLCMVYAEKNLEDLSKFAEEMLVELAALDIIVRTR